MKKYKSLISLILILGMLATMLTFQVSAEERIVVSGVKYTSITPANWKNYSLYTTLIDFSTGGTVTYTLNVPENGNYHMSIDARINTTATLTITSGLDSFELKDTVQVRKERYVGKVSLKAGDNVVTFSTKGGAVGLYNIYLEKASDKIDSDFGRMEGTYKNHYLPAVIQAEDYDIGPNGSYSSKAGELTEYRGEANVPVIKSADEYVIELRTDSWTKYTFNCEQDGSYNVTAKSDNTGSLGFYFDGNEYPILINTKAGGEAEVGNLFFKKGQHTLVLKSQGTSQNVDYISFKSSYVKGQDPEALITIPPTEEELEAMKKEGRPVWKEIWVDGSVTESGDGTIEKPYKTIEEAKEAVKAVRNQMKGDIVVKIAPYEYEIDEKIIFTNDDGGINGYRVVYQGANTFERPIISGGTHIDGWVPHENGVWKTKVEEADEIRQLYINGYAAQRARSKYLYNIDGEYDDPETTEYTVDGYGITKLNSPVISKPHYAEVIYNQLWTQNRVPLKKIVDGGDVWWYVFDQPYFDQMRRNYNTNLRTMPGGKVYIENAYELIDEYGEFYFDRDTKEIFYYPFPEEDMKTADTVIGRCELMIQLVGNSKEDRIEGITFDNLDFRYGTWLDSSRTGVAFFQADDIIDENTDPNRVQTLGRHVPAAMEVSYARDITVKNCAFQDIGSAAIAMSYWVDDSLVDGNVFREIAGSAVSVGDWNVTGYDKGTFLPSDLCKNNTITNNVVRRAGFEYAGCPGIASYYAKSTTVSHNDIKDTSYTGVSMGWGWGSKASPTLGCSDHIVTNNRIENISMTVRDGGHIYMLSDMDPILIEGNYLIHSNDFGGVYLDTGTSGATITRNVFKECFYDNICFGRGEANQRNLAFNNWADKLNDKTTEWIGEGSKFEIPMVITDDNWPAEAVEVMENAGLKRGYKRLLSGVEYPAWRTKFMDSIPRTFFHSNNIIETLSPDYMEGGAEVAYHKAQKGEPPKVMTVGLNTAIGQTNNGDWIKYNVNVGRETDFIFDLHYSYKMSDAAKQENVSSKAGISVYVDDVKVYDNVNLPDTGSWNSYIAKTLGEPIHLTEGEHIIKVEFIQAWSFEKFRLKAADITGTDPDYDDGIMLIREGAQQ